MRELTKMFGRLIGILLAKNVITLDEFNHILTGFEGESEERKCEDCDYSEPLHWEQDKRTGRASVAEYWCDKHQRRCDKPCKDFLTEVSE